MAVAHAHAKFENKWRRGSSTIPLILAESRVQEKNLQGYVNLRSDWT